MMIGRLLTLGLVLLAAPALAFAQAPACPQFFAGGEAPALVNARLGQRTTLLCNDAWAASRPTMRFVPVKSATAQAEAMDLTARDLLVRQRTQLVNAIAQRSAGGKDGEAVPAGSCGGVRRHRGQRHCPGRAAVEEDR